MRAWGLVAVLCAGCQFAVIGTPVGGGGTGDPGQPTATPPVDDTTQPQSPPTSASPPPGTWDAAVPPSADMSVQRIGTPCTADAQCDPGLICAKTFYMGLVRVDIPGGYCTLSCASDPTLCPASSFCGVFNFGKFCLSDCPPDPCRKGYSCCNPASGPDGPQGCTPSMLCPKE